MLHTIRHLIGLPIHATDGAIGKIIDIYFNDKSWGIEFFVVEIDRRLFDKRVILAPSVLAVDADTVQCELSKYQVERCPDWDLRVPVYRQHQETGTSAYLTVPSLPDAPFNGLAYDSILPGEGGQEDLVQGRLRSMVHFLTYTVEEESKPLGEISDFAINPACWIIDRLIAADRSESMQRISVLPVSCVEHIDFKNAVVYATGTACRSN